MGGRYLVEQVPFSCCSPLSPRPCIQQQVGDASAHFNYDRVSRELNLWRRGCREALMEHYSAMAGAVGLTVLLIWVFEVLLGSAPLTPTGATASSSFLSSVHQLLVLTGVRYLQTAMENVLRLGDLDSESDGWILEDSLAETARYNLNIIKNLGKCYQVDHDPNINVQTGPPEREVPPELVPAAARSPWTCEEPG